MKGSKQLQQDPIAFADGAAIRVEGLGTAFGTLDADARHYRGQGDADAVTLACN